MTLALQPSDSHLTDVIEHLGPVFGVGMLAVAVTLLVVLVALGIYGLVRGARPERQPEPMPQWT